ncbi:uncharacterized protein LOC130046451 isoform X2 [Ostrea edulis]|nr:uncharacterized protein LOC130046451 isoform X2 [Ostrea edulis]
MDNCPTNLVLIVFIVHSCLILKTRQQLQTSINLQSAIDFEEMLMRKNCSIDVATIADSQCTQCCTLTSQKSNVHSNDSSWHVYLSLNITYKNSHLIKNSRLFFCGGDARGTSYSVVCIIRDRKRKCKECARDMDDFKQYRANKSGNCDEKSARKHGPPIIVGIICLVSGVIVGVCLKSILSWRTCQSQSTESTSPEAVQNAVNGDTSQDDLNADQILEVLSRSQASSSCQNSNLCNNFSKAANKSEFVDEIDIHVDHYEQIGMIQTGTDSHPLDVNHGHTLYVNHGHALVVNHGHALDVNHGHALDVNHGHVVDDTNNFDYLSLGDRLGENYCKLSKRV